MTWEDALDMIIMVLTAAAAAWAIVWLLTLAIIAGS